MEGQGCGAHQPLGRTQLCYLLAQPLLVAAAHQQREGQLSSSVSRQLTGKAGMGFERGPDPCPLPHERPASTQPALRTASLLCGKVRPLCHLRGRCRGQSNCRHLPMLKVAVAWLRLQRIYQGAGVLGRRARPSGISSQGVQGLLQILLWA